MRRLLMFLVFCLVIGSCASCFNQGISKTYVDFSSFVQYESSVRIGVLCEGQFIGAGSGFIVGPRKIITAAHMLACDDAVFLIKYRHGNEIKETYAIKDTVDDYIDAMSLMTWNELPIKARVSREKPLVGDVVCSIGGGSIEVGWIKKCGYVAYFDEESIISSLPTVPGNSGSPLYDKHGYVVGMVVAGSWGVSAERYSLALTSSAWKSLL